MLEYQSEQGARLKVKKMGYKGIKAHVRKTVYILDKKNKEWIVKRMWKVVF